MVIWDDIPGLDNPPSTDVQQEVLQSIQDEMELWEQRFPHPRLPILPERVGNPKPVENLQTAFDEPEKTREESESAKIAYEKERLRAIYLEAAGNDAEEWKSHLQSLEAYRVAYESYNETVLRNKIDDIQARRRENVQQGAFNSSSGGATLRRLETTYQELVAKRRQLQAAIDEAKAETTP